MYSYLAYNLRVESDLLLPGFLAASGEQLPSIRVRRDSIAEENLWDLNNDGDRLAGVAPEVLRFIVEGGEVITVDPEPGADEGYVRAIVTGELFSVLLRQRGLLALHGSCVARDGEAIGFIGHSGWGKSTLASFFVQQGYSLLNDDVIAIDFSGPFPVVVPGYAQVKLQPDAGERFLQNFDLLPEAHTETDKRVFCHDERFQRQSTRLRKIYVLEGEIRPVQRLVPLPRQHAFLELVRHTRGNRLLKSEHFRQLHLEQCTTLLRQVSVSLLHRMRSFDLLPELYGLIEEDLHQLQS